MGRSPQETFVINELSRILDEERSGAGAHVELLIKLRLIRYCSARAKVVRSLYHEYKGNGATASISVWRIADEVGISDSLVWKIIKSKK
jgi:hypothetical protein